MTPSAEDRLQTLIALYLEQWKSETALRIARRKLNTEFEKILADFKRKESKE